MIERLQHRAVSVEHLDLLLTLWEQGNGNDSLILRYLRGVSMESLFVDASFLLPRLEFFFSLQSRQECIDNE